MNWLSRILEALCDLLEWVIKHPFLALIIALVCIYAFACAIDLFAPIDTDRGSWWNIAYWLFRFIAEA